jgi:leucine dehydrogenase
MFSHPDYDGHEALLFTKDAASGLRALIAIHDTTLGLAFGGCRMYPYASEQHAMTDVLRLSRGMTYKAAICELPYGGGKSVMIADPRRDKTPALLHAMGRIIEGLGGRYITAEDVSTTLADGDFPGIAMTLVGQCRKVITSLDRNHAAGLSNGAPLNRATLVSLSR